MPLSMPRSQVGAWMFPVQVTFPNGEVDDYPQEMTTYVMTRYYRAPEVSRVCEAWGYGMALQNYVVHMLEDCKRVDVSQM
jgi:hypothetical protein